MKRGISTITGATALLILSFIQAPGQLPKFGQSGGSGGGGGTGTVTSIATTSPITGGTITTTGTIACATCQTGTPTNHGVAIGSATQDLSYTGAGTAGQALLSNGPSSDPSFQAIPVSAPPQILFGSYPGAAPLAGAGALYSPLAGVFTLDATEANPAMVIKRSGTLQNLCTSLFAAQGANGTLVVTLRKNAANTALTFTVAASAVAGNYCDSTHTVSVVSGDSLDISYLNTATAATAMLTHYLEIQ